MGVDIGFRSVYLFHTYCIHSCIVASPTSCSTCQVLPHFKRRGYKTPFAFPQLNSELLIRLFMNNTRNKCKTLWSRILQPPLIQFSIYTSACSACQVVPCSRRPGVNIYLVVSYNMFSSWEYTEEVSNMLLTGNTMWQQFRYGVDIGFRSVYFLHTYCIHSCIVASATLRSTCQVLTRFRQQGSKTPCGFPQLNSDFSIGLFLNNIRNKCKTLWSTILQPPLIHTV